MPSQRTPAGEALLRSASTHNFIAPYLFPGEIRNALLMLERRGRLGSDETVRAMIALASYGVDIEPAPPPSVHDAILDLARRERLTVYHATYLWSAMQGGFTLASRDTDLLAAASRNGLPTADLRHA